MSERLPAASVPRKETAPFSLRTTGSVYALQVWPSSEYSFTVVLSEKVAVTVTSWFVGSVTFANATGFSGATLSMFVTS